MIEIEAQEQVVRLYEKFGFVKSRRTFLSFESTPYQNDLQKWKSVDEPLIVTVWIAFLKHGVFIG